MTFKALFCRIMIAIAGGLSAVAANAATSSDIFIDSVTPVALPAKDKGSGIMASIGSRRDVLHSLRVLQSRQLQALAAIRNLPPAKAANPSVVSQKRELDLRRQFYDQVIFSIDAKWNDGPLKGFLEKEFLSRAQNDIDSDTESGPSSGASDAVNRDPLWKFYTYLSVAIRDLPEPREDLVSFIQGYIDFSTLAQPKPPADYVAQRAYSNGVVSQAAHTLPPDEVGDGVERLLHARGLDKSTRRAALSRTEPHASDIEIRMHVDMTPPPDAVLPPIQSN